jgi:hypothetical protein
MAGLLKSRRPWNYVERLFSVGLSQGLPQVTVQSPTTFVELNGSSFHVNIGGVIVVIG